MTLYLLGKCLLLGGLSALGLKQAAALRRRSTCLKEFLAAIEHLERELGFSLLPVEGLLAQMKAGSRGEARAFFEACERRFAEREEERLEEIWRKGLEVSPLSLRGEDRGLLAEVGSILGRYDCDSQRLAFRRIHGRLEELIGEATEEAKRMGRVFSTLGIALGLFCCILL